MLELIIYMAGVIIMMIAFAIRTPYQNIDAAVIISLLWPLSLVVMTMLKCMWIMNWDMDVVKVDKWFGYRKATNPKVKGFAITAIKLEFQFWKRK